MRNTISKLALLLLALSPLVAMGVVGASALEDSRENLQTEVDWTLEADTDGEAFQQQELAQ